MSEEVVKVVGQMVAPVVVAPAAEPAAAPSPVAAPVVAEAPAPVVAATSAPVIAPALAPAAGASEAVVPAAASTAPVEAPTVPAVEAAPPPPPVKQKRPGGYELPKRLLTQLRRVESERGRDAVAEKNDAFLMDADSGAPSYLTWDGHVVIDDGGSVRDASEDEKIAAVVAGARKTGLTVLLNLLPPRAANATTCRSCEGGRWATETRVCPTCHGRGWC